MTNLFFVIVMLVRSRGGLLPVAFQGVDSQPSLHQLLVVVIQPWGGQDDGNQSRSQRLDQRGVPVVFPGNWVE